MVILAVARSYEEGGTGENERKNEREKGVIG
jgi:hypothetical protein